MTFLIDLQKPSHRSLNCIRLMHKQMPNFSMWFKLCVFGVNWIRIVSVLLNVWIDWLALSFDAATTFMLIINWWLRLSRSSKFCVHSVRRTRNHMYGTYVTVSSQFTSMHINAAVSDQSGARSRVHASANPIWSRRPISIWRACMPTENEQELSFQRHHAG